MTHRKDRTHRETTRDGGGIRRGPWLLAGPALLGLSLGLPPGALAQSGEESGRSYAYGSLTFVEGDVWHQRADDFGAHEAESGSPFLPGDRIWTREPGQVELRFAGEVVAWMDERTKLDYVEGDLPHRLGFWTGSLIVAVGDDAELVIETPGGTLVPQGQGEYRTDLLDDGRTVQFVVREGVATVSTESGSVLVGAGQRTLATAGAAPSAAERYRDDGDFQAWAEQRDSRAARVTDAPYEELPEEVREHVHDLHDHGHWRHDVHLGWVWYPRVSVGWAPYRIGRWARTPFGYTWISHDPWGWAPFHYGRWGHGPHGWYWLPGSVWSPGWVSWSYGADWIGWAPLSYYGYPVYGFHDYRGAYGVRRLRRGTVLGQAVPRGSAVNRKAWSFTNRSALGRPASRKRLAASSLRNVEKARLLTRGAVLDRANTGVRQRGVGATAMARSAKATTRRISNARAVATRTATAPGATARAVRRTAVGQRVAAPAGAARARSAARARPRPSATTVGRSATGGVRSATGGVRSRSGAASSARGTRSSAGGATRAPRPRASGSGSRAVRRRPSSVRPPASSSSTSRRRPNSAAPRRPNSATRSRPNSAAPRRPNSAAPRRPNSATRSRPNSATRSRPNSATRSRPNSAAPRRPNSATRSRPNSAAPRRPNSTTRSRPNSATRSRPSSAARSRPSSAARSRPDSAPRSRPNSGARRRPNETAAVIASAERAAARPTSLAT